MIDNKNVATTLNKLMIEITGKINESIILVQEQCSQEEFENYRRVAGKVMGYIFLDIMEPIYTQHPQFIPDELGMDILTEDEITKLAISSEDVEIIQQQLLTHITNSWKKMALVIAESMSELKTKDSRWNGIPRDYYAHLIRELVVTDKVSSRGDLNRMRYCEICMGNNDL